MIKKIKALISRLIDILFAMSASLIKKISVCYTKILIKKELYKIGKSASGIDPNLAVRFNVPIVKMKEEEANLDQKLNSLNDGLNEKKITFHSKKREFDMLISELNDRIKAIKSDEKKIQYIIKGNKNKLKLRLLLESKKTKKYTLLTIFKDKVNFNNTVFDLTNTVNENIAAKDTIKAELQRVETRCSGALKEWTMLSKSLNDDIKILETEMKMIQDMKKSIDNKIRSFYPVLGLKIDEEDAYPEALYADKLKMQELKRKL